MIVRRITVAALIVLHAAAAAQEAKPPAKPTSAAAASAKPFAKWEKEIAAMEAGDRKSPPPTGGIVFIGSSTVRMWKSLDTDYPGQPVINRGFGGSQIVDATHYLPRIVFPLQPRVIFLRSGTNDIHAGKSPGKVFSDYKDFVAAIHARLPDTEIIFIGLAPTIARITEIEKNNQLGALVRDYSASNAKLKYIDCATLTLGPDGQPRAELFLPDKLHFSAAGYRLLAEKVRPFLPPPPAKPAR